MTESIKSAEFIQELSYQQKKVSELATKLEKNGLKNFSDASLQMIISIADELWTSSLEIIDIAEKVVNKNDPKRKNLSGRSLAQQTINGGS